MTVKDQKTAEAFANSWNNLPLGSIYTRDQFEDWLEPLTMENIKGKKVLELGCGNASLMMHLATWSPEFIEGVDLGNSVRSARKNLGSLNFKNWRITQDDITAYRSGGFDLVYCIGVLHHLKQPKNGLDSVIANVKPGGRFHCWVYAREGNNIIVYLVDPLRKIASRLPWRFTKYFLATPLAFLFFLYAKFLSEFSHIKILRNFPLYPYSRWIAKRELSFFRHVAFDQLVTPQTVYLSQQTIAGWLKSYKNIDQGSVYLIMRNGNSWKFGGKTK